MNPDQISPARARAALLRPGSDGIARIVSLEPAVPLARPRLLLDVDYLAETGLWGFAPLDPRARPFVRLRSQVLSRLTPGERQKVIAVVSPRSGTGKSFVAANLAAALCQLQNVCLVDLDLRSPAIGTLLGVPDCARVNAVLKDGRAIADIGCVAEDGRLVVLPASEAAADATRLLASDALPNLFDALRREPDTISIVDAPAMLAMDDAILITRHVDGVIVVIEEGRTTARDVRETLRLLHPTPLLGTVLNRSLGGGA